MWEGGWELECNVRMRLTLVLCFVSQHGTMDTISYGINTGSEGGEGEGERDII